MSVIHNQKLVTAASEFYGAFVSLQDRAQTILGMVPTFPEKVSANDLSDIKTGLTQRACQVIPTQFYSQSGDSFTRLDAKQVKSADATKVFTLTAEYAINETKHALGQMAKQTPGKHKLVSAMRKRVQTDVSNRLADLGKIAKQLRDIKVSRGPSAPLNERRTKMLAAIDKMEATARKNGDPAALPDEIVKLAEAAYMRVIENYRKGKT